MNTTAVPVVLRMKLHSALPVTLNKVSHPKVPCHIKKELLVTVFCYSEPALGEAPRCTVHAHALEAELNALLEREPKPGVGNPWCSRYLCSWGCASDAVNMVGCVLFLQ